MRKHPPAPFQRLAFVAILALACVPTLGRMWQGASSGAEATHEASTAPDAGHHAHHGEHTVVPETPAPTPHHGTSGDCEYCPLLQGLLTPRAAPIESFVAWAPSAPRARATDTRFDTPHPTGLGSRGPPLS